MSNDDLGSSSRPIIRVTSPSCEANHDSPALSDLSPRDKPWDKHRAFADRVEQLYAGTEFNAYSTRIHFCSQLLEFGLKPADDETLKLKLRSARFCRVPRCPVCSWRRSLRWKARAHQVLPQIIDKHPTSRWVFMTLTVKNCPIEDLRQTLTLMNKGFRKMSQRKIWPALGWLRSTEVTRGRDGNAHPHFHCLLMMPRSYFGRKYIKQNEWAKLWQDCMQLSYKPVIDVRAVRQAEKPMQLIPELIKYCVKESDLVADREWFLELTRQLYNMKLISTGGVLRKYLSELEREPEDLVGEGDEADSEDVANLYFSWRKAEKRYRLD